MDVLHNPFKRITYDQKDILGKGATSAVYRGRFDETPVAVKRIRSDSIDAEREAQLCDLNHDSVIKLIHVEADGPFQ